MSNTFGFFTFDGQNKVISCSLGVVSFSAANLYSRWKEWCRSSDNIKYEPAFANSVGGESLGGNIFVGAYYFLQNGWVIKPQEADHQLILSGNLFPIPDTSALFTGTDGNFQVIVGMRTSSLTQQVISGGNTSGAEDIATAVWNTDIDNVNTGVAEDIKEIKNNSGLIGGLY